MKAGKPHHDCMEINRSEKKRFLDNPEKLMTLFKVGQLITSELDFNTLFDVVVEQTNNLIGTERCSIFLIDDKKKYLKAFVSIDLKQHNFRLPKDKGIAGWVYNHKSPLVVNDAYKDHRFSKKADSESGFRTKTILCTPLIGRNTDCLGTMQVINKKSGLFTDDDRELIAFIASYVSIAIENSMFYEEVKESDRAKGKAISHLSHELKTPLAIIKSAFDRIAFVTLDQESKRITKPILRGKRNVNRLIDLQYKVDDILGQKAADKKSDYLSMIEDMKGLIEECYEIENPSGEEIVKQLIRRVNDILQVKEPHFETIDLNEFINELCAGSSSECEKRDITLKIDLTKQLTIEMDRESLTTACTGLLKNAIENTPDQGVVRLAARETEEAVLVTIKDHGIGITLRNRKNIFKGFFHTQETAAYSSKRPYQFNAGGAGTDLLRIRVLAERLGFSIDFKTDRCGFIPLDKDVCPGSIGLCEHICTPDDCITSGGSRFTLVFKKVR